MDPFPVRNPWLAAASGIAEINAAAARALQASQAGLDGRYPHVAEVTFGDNVDPDRARHFLDGMLLAAEHFPDAPVSLVDDRPLSNQPLVGVDHGQVSAQTGSTLYMSPSADNKPDRFVHARSEILVDSDSYLSADPDTQRINDAALRATERDRLLLGLGAILPTPAGVHEYIHSVDKAMAHPEWREADVVPGHPLALRDEALAEVGRRVGKPTDQVSREDVVSVWGEYAATDLSEFVPLLVADKIVNGPYADRFSHRVYDRLQVAVSNFKPGPGAKLQKWRGRPRTDNSHGISELFDEYPVLPPGAPTASPGRLEDARISRTTEIHGAMAVACAGLTPAANTAAAPKSPAPRSPSTVTANRPEILRSTTPPQIDKAHELKEAPGLGTSLELN
ncbi:hypothetical protein [Streptodolium elevatio]